MNSRSPGLAGGSMQATISRTNPTAKAKQGISPSWTAGLLILALKGKGFLFGLLKIKYLMSAFTAVISVFAYAGRFGWEGAIGFVVLLFVHEMGHVLALRAQGVAATAPMFIPFFGAIIGMKQNPKSAVEEAYSAIAGPALGSVGALACVAVYFVTGSQLFAWLAYIGFFLNLFNLLPMSPLDGGRVVGAVWRGFWLVGIVAAVALAALTGSFLLFLISIFGLSEINRRYIGIHWTAYAALGIIAVVSSFMHSETFMGILIGVFATTHAMKASSERKLAVAKAATHGLFKIAHATWCPLAAGYPHSATAAVGKTLGRAPGRFEKGAAYFTVSKQQRIAIGSVYVGLACTLTGLLVWMHSAGLFSNPASLHH
jgi:Zn-dependent protease